ncbi:MAG: lysophospholipid acyltransferase family protein [Hyphomicrobiaceae bacterium]|nr:lysophospholipid acyltransferase family protein [Hyphomicrobiaceae bacterium]
MLRSALFNVAFYANTALFLIVGAPLLLAPRSWAMAGLVAHARVSLWLMRVIVGTQLEVRGRDHLPEGAYLVAAKHQSAWDTFALIPIFKDPAMVMKAELGSIPLYGWFSRKFEHLLIQREKGPAALKRLIRDARARAAQGREIVIFPEGTRRPPNAPADYKPGAVALYESLELPCVPIALNSGLYWPRQSQMRYPGSIVVQILPPIPPGLPRAVFRERLQTAIETASKDLILEARESRNAPPMPVTAQPEAAPIKETM